MHSGRLNPVGFFSGGYRDQYWGIRFTDDVAFFFAFPFEFVSTTLKVSLTCQKPKIRVPHPFHENAHFTENVPEAFNSTGTEGFCSSMVLTLPVGLGAVAVTSRDWEMKSEGMDTNE